MGRDWDMAPIAAVIQSALVSSKMSRQFLPVMPCGHREMDMHKYGDIKDWIGRKKIIGHLWHIHFLINPPP